MLRHSESSVQLDNCSQRLDFEENQRFEENLWVGKQPAAGGTADAKVVEELGTEAVLGLVVVEHVLQSDLGLHREGPPILERVPRR